MASTAPAASAGSIAPGPGQRVLRWFGVDDPWERSAPPVGRSDVFLTALLAVFGLASLELVRSVGALQEVSYPWWVQWVAVATGAALLVGRRRWPLTVACSRGPA